MKYVIVFLQLIAPVISQSLNCNSGDVFDQNRCYNLPSVSLDFISAHYFCASMGYELVSITNLFTNNYILAEAETHFKDLSNFWIGFVNTNGTWVWLDGTINNGFQNWAPQSSNWTLPLAATVRQSDGKWDPMQLNASLPFVCASPTGGPTTPKVTTKSTTTGPPRTKPHGNSCPGNLYYNGDTGYCYAGFVGGGLSSWTEASSFCEIWGNTVQLASIHFDEENTAVAKDAEGYAWIGLRGPTKDNMTWSDGTPVDYTNWIADDGSFACYDGDCCSLMDGRSGQWYFTDCKRAEDDSLVDSVVCKATPI